MPTSDQNGPNHAAITPTNATNSGRARMCPGPDAMPSFVSKVLDIDASDSLRA
jgi:hypothetical protein